MRYVTNKSPETHVLRTKCVRCGCDGYIFPDQIPNGVRLQPRDHWYSKCCNGRKRHEKKSEIKYFVDSARAARLQNIRKRETTIDPNNAVSFD